MEDLNMNDDDDVKAMEDSNMNNTTMEEDLSMNDTAKEDLSVNETLNDPSSSDAEYNLKMLLGKVRPDIIVALSRYENHDGVGIFAKVFEKHGINRMEFFQRLETETNLKERHWYLGVCYQYGLTGDIDLRKAFKHYDTAALNGDPESMTSVGLCYLKSIGVNGEKSIAYGWFKEAASLGCVRAQNCLGYCYEFGCGIQRDETLSVKWYTQSAESGNPHAQNNLGYSYEAGTGVKRSEENALYWFQRAADSELASGKYNVGRLRAKGKDKDTAFLWHMKSAKAGLPMGQTAVGRSYLDGTGVEKDESMGVYWLLKGAHAGNPEAQDLLIRNFVESTTRWNSPRKIFRVVRRSARARNPWASGCLGFCHFEAIGTSKDIHSALRWYRAAREDNFPNAPRLLHSIFRR